MFVRFVNRSIILPTDLQGGSQGFIEKSMKYLGSIRNPARRSVKISIGRLVKSQIRIFYFIEASIIIILESSAPIRGASF